MSEESRRVQQMGQQTLHNKLKDLILLYGEDDSPSRVGSPVKNLLFWSNAGGSAATADMCLHNLELSDYLQGVGLLCESL